MKLEDLIRTWGKVFGNWKYLVSAIIVAFMFYSFNVLLSSLGSLIGFYSGLGLVGTIKFFFTLLWGFGETTTFSSHTSLITISILFGALFSLIVYKINLGNVGPGKKLGIFGSVGVFLAAFVPGCAACGVGLASFLGIGAGFLLFLPYNGLELSVVAIAILGVTMVKLTNDMYKCNVSRSLLNRELKGGIKK